MKQATRTIPRAGPKALVRVGITKTEHLQPTMKAVRMLSEQINNDQLTVYVQQERDDEIYLPYHTPRQERTLKALTLLLGPETDYELRRRASRHVARRGMAALPLLLHTLNHHPEITSPAWPWWPPQYEHCSRLLLHLCQQAHLPLESILQDATLTQPIGPVLWISIIEAVDAQPQAKYETLLRNGLQAAWETTRYAAAMALANLAETEPLHKETLVALHSCLHAQEMLPVRLATAYALLRSNDNNGIQTLMSLLTEHVPTEVRKATVFMLASEPPEHLSSQHQKRLTQLLLHALQEEHHDIRQYAARALSGIALASTPLLLCPLLDSGTPSTQIAALLALEEMAQCQELRSFMRKHVVSNILPLLHSTQVEVRRQSSHTLASIGGEYVMAALGTALYLHEQKGYIEAIEGLRLLYGVLRTPKRAHVTRWLLSTLCSTQEEVQVTALDSLAYLVWQAHVQRHKEASTEICTAILEDGRAAQLLNSSSAWVRQRAIELLCMLNNQSPTLHSQLVHLLHMDDDSGVRACIAFILGQIHAHWAIPDLLLTLLDPDTQVAITALHTLGELANFDHAIVAYSIQELTFLQEAKEEDEDELVKEARLILKEWRKKCRSLV